MHGTRPRRDSQGSPEHGSPEHGSPNPVVAASIVVAMLVMVIIPAAITLHSVRAPGQLVFENGNRNASPYGYTISLLLFIVPIVVIAFWFLPSEGLEIPRRAFWRTVGILVPAGFALDYVFAQWFFSFPEPGATLGIHAWALGRPVPIEEYVFYLTGFIAVLLLYVWMSEYWLAAYSAPDYPAEARAMRRRVINWRAFSLTFFFILLISLLCEATLALPYGWWNYQHRSMLGLFIGAWTQLPIEAVCVWIAVTYATTIVFEIIKLWQASGRPVREVMFGPKGATSAAD